MTPYERLLDRVDTPAVVVTTAVGETRSGCLVTFASPCSMEPPRFGVWLSTVNRTYELAAGASALAVHFLSEAHRPTAELFGGETGFEIDKFARCGWSPGPEGLPVLDDCVGWFVGRIVEWLPTGDHTLHVLAPVAAEVREPGEGRVLGLREVRDISPGRLDDV
jgi:flavin reductase (DIM6/NTAB) family NADH-FMN oxidoreductase RutF